MIPILEERNWHQQLPLEPANIDDDGDVAEEFYEATSSGGFKKISYATPFRGACPVHPDFVSATKASIPSMIPVAHGEDREVKAEVCTGNSDMTPPANRNSTASGQVTVFRAVLLSKLLPFIVISVLIWVALKQSNQSCFHLDCCIVWPSYVAAAWQIMPRISRIVMLWPPNLKAATENLWSLKAVVFSKGSKLIRQGQLWWQAGRNFILQFSTCMKIIPYEIAARHCSLPDTYFHAAMVLALLLQCTAERVSFSPEATFEWLLASAFLFKERYYLRHVPCICLFRLFMCILVVLGCLFQLQFSTFLCAHSAVLHMEAEAGLDALWCQCCSTILGGWSLWVLYCRKYDRRRFLLPCGHLPNKRAILFRKSIAATCLNPKFRGKLKRFRDLLSSRRMLFLVYFWAQIAGVFTSFAAHCRNALCPPAKRSHSTKHCHDGSGTGALISIEKSRVSNITSFLLGTFCIMACVAGAAGMQGNAPAASNSSNAVAMLDVACGIASAGASLVLRRARDAARQQAYRERQQQQQVQLPDLQEQSALPGLQSQPFSPSSSAPGYASVLAPGHSAGTGARSGGSPAGRDLGYMAALLGPTAGRVRCRHEWTPPSPSGSRDTPSSSSRPSSRLCVPLQGQLAPRSKPE